MVGVRGIGEDEVSEFAIGLAWGLASKKLDLVGDFEGFGEWLALLLEVEEVELFDKFAVGEESEIDRGRGDVFFGEGLDGSFSFGCSFLLLMNIGAD